MPVYVGAQTRAERYVGARTDAELYVGAGVLGWSPPPLPSRWLGAATFDADVQDEFDTWIGVPADFLWMTTLHDSWTNFDNGFAASLAAFPGDTRPIIWSLPLSVWGTTLAEIAAGDFDDHFIAAAEAMLAAAPEDFSAIIVRMGWEANYTGLWSWTAVGVEADYIAAWRRVHGLLRAVSIRFMFDWCLNYVQHSDSYDPSTFYPGDAYVDIISTDLYYRALLDGDGFPTNPDPEGVWNYVKALPFGLDWIAGFAATHGKPMAIPECGFTWEKPQWVELFADWAESLPDVVYQAIFDNNQDPSHPTRVSDGSKGLAGHAYRMRFGEDVPVYGAGSFTGYTPGVLGSGGVLPTGFDPIFGDASIEVIGVEVHNQVECLRLRFAATSTGAAFTRYGKIYYLGPAAAQNDVFRSAAAISVEDEVGGGATLLSAEIAELNGSYAWVATAGEYDAADDYETYPVYADHHTYHRKLTHPDVAHVTGLIGVFLDASALPSSADVLIAGPVLTKSLGVDV